MCYVFDIMAEEIRHFMKFQNGSAKARIDFSEPQEGSTRVYVTVEMCVDGRFWTDYSDAVRSLLRFQSLTPGACNGSPHPIADKVSE
jgi:hypothetical protein